MRDEPKVAAIVVSFNRRVLLQECVEGLLNQTRPVDEIFVIDNGSNDGSREYLASIEAKYDNITAVFSAQNLGGAGGFSTGLITAFEKGFDWYWLMDDDAEPMSDALEKLMSSEHATREDVVAMCGAVCSIDGQTQFWHQGTYDERMYLVAPTSENHATQSFRIDFMSFVGACIRHEAVRRVGFPLKEYFVWHDDVEYTTRLSRIGEVRCVTASRMVHKDSETRDLPRHSLSFRDWYDSRKMPAAAQWKHACGLRNYVDMIFRHRGRAPLWAASMFGRRLVRIIIFGDRNPKVFRLYLRYFQQALGFARFETVLPSDWKNQLNDTESNRTSARKQRREAVRQESSIEAVSDRDGA
ncbi:Galactofuranosyl transferase GlfT1 [Caballeronia arvi]|uniref:Galactofuranosyl transferase GlfT1 n=1 Tax=Caballeronia arvi TaxID=1777135 RepID=A0A158EPS5_9BURK|nr:glycosyltransferase family 2 protein [Caballeronia arvi]SAL09483.1 Galactofuranosyl transferase GlfT1 [Caballeronia arvi]